MAEPPRDNDVTGLCCTSLRMAYMRTALWAAALLLCVQRTGAEAILQNGSVGAGPTGGDPRAVIVLPFPSDSSAINGAVNVNSSTSTDGAPGPLGGPLLEVVPVHQVIMLYDEPAASSGASSSSSTHIPRSAGPLMQAAGSVQKTNTLASRSRVTGSW